MATSEPGSTAARLAKGWSAKAKHAAATLKQEYEAGRRGDDAPAEQIWGTPKDHLDGVIALLRSMRGSSVGGENPVLVAPDPSDPAVGSHPGGVDGVDGAGGGDADVIADALGRVDWASVRTVTSARTSEAAKAARAMADQVDWAKLQPVASQVSRALIAAVAAGQIPVGGRVGATVAKAISDQGGLGGRVAEHLDRAHVPLPDEFRRAIDATSRET